jgi:uncharacterized membrane protein YphA (DoxX/SURF4 family)
MSLVRMAARPMLASMFVYGGLDSLRHPEAKAARAAGVAKAFADVLPIGLPEDPVQLVRINGAVQLGAGLLLATGKMSRLAALALAGSLVPTTAAGHRFWEAEDPTAKRAQRIQFLKNVSMFGGLIFAALDTEGRPSLLWRARRATRHTADVLHDALPGAH